MKPSARYSVALCCILLSALLAFAAGCEKNKKKTKAPKAVQVKAIRAEPAPEIQMRRLPAVVRPELETALGFLVKGKVTDLPVTIGQQVKKGDVIARLQPEDYENAVKQARAALGRARAMQRDARAQYERVQKLWTSQDADASQLDKARAYAQSADNEVAMIALKARELDRQLGYTTLKAPSDGFIADKLVQLYDTVPSGQGVVLFVDVTPLKVRAHIPAPLIGEVDRFTKYTVTFPLLGGRRFDAALVGIGPSALAPAGTYPISVSINPPAEAHIRPGMTALLEIAVRRPEGQAFIELPLSAVDTDPKGKSYVWVVDEKTSAVSRRSVTLGKLARNGVEVLSGLQPGEWVVTAGLNKLKPGGTVHIMRDKAAETGKQQTRG